MDQAELSEYTAETSTATVTRTVVCNLETSNQKNETVRQAIDEWQGVAVRMAELMPSFPEHRWGQRDTQMTRLAKQEFPDLTIYAHDRNEAVNKVREAFDSWASRGREGRNPRGEFGESDYVRVCGCCSRMDIVQNGRGYGLRVKLLKRHDPLWFHINVVPIKRSSSRRSSWVRLRRVVLSFDSRKTVAWPAI